MNYNKINKCIACGGKNLDLLLDLGKQPLANSFKKTADEKEPTFPLAVNRCMDCSHVQLTHQVNPDLLFKNYLYVSGTSQTQLEYFDWFAAVSTTLVKNANTVLDIGCNDGSQLNSYKNLGLNTYGVDPAENLHPLSTANGHDVHCGYFTGKEFKEKFDIVTCQNAFAHNTDQLKLIRNVKKVLNKNGMFFATISQCDMIPKNEFDTIYHEHVSFYCVKSFNELCKRAGINLVDVIYHPIHGGTYIFVMSNNIENSEMESYLDIEEKSGYYLDQTFNDFHHHAEERARIFKEKIVQYRNQGKKVIGFGAPAKANTFMNYAGIGPDIIIDENKLKQGTFSPGLGIPVVGPEILKEYESVDSLVFIPLAWNFYDEIVKKIKTLRPNKNDEFFTYFGYQDEQA